MWLYSNGLGYLVLFLLPILPTLLVYFLVIIAFLGFRATKKYHEREHIDFLAFINANHKELVSDKPLTWYGIPITPATEVISFPLVYSFILVTTEVPSKFFIKGQSRLSLLATKVFFLLFTLLFGWWAFPKGPYLTLKAIDKILFGEYQKVSDIIKQNNP